ncbi:hypothetical protein [Rufibacter ruber]|uniref:hypothetical protein n=1 Tax=Rufibacter ruber TaxID=1783499 RepID=UPI000834CDEE|nr:hypothetical protein [Rufibacter ruber]
MEKVMDRKLGGFQDLEEALDYLRAQRYRHTFQCGGQGWYCPETGHSYLPEELVMHACHRFSQRGGTNTVTVLYAVSTQDGQKGLILDNCSTYGNLLFGEYLVRMKLQQL